MTCVHHMTAVDDRTPDARLRAVES
ncbi:MAG: hypothetical protein QOJ74_2377, partial [Ilumatobacteraceae bacterium]|nr:hypothetical protein [Ilumatobacteraceae bacterium]